MAIFGQLRLMEVNGVPWPTTDMPPIENLIRSGLSNWHTRKFLRCEYAKDLKRLCNQQVGKLLSTATNRLCSFSGLLKSLLNYSFPVQPFHGPKGKP